MVTMNFSRAARRISRAEGTPSRAAGAFSRSLSLRDILQFTSFLLFILLKQTFRHKAFSAVRLKTVCLQVRAPERRVAEFRDHARAARVPLAGDRILFDPQEKRTLDHRFCVVICHCMFCARRAQSSFFGFAAAQSTIVRTGCRVYCKCGRASLCAVHIIQDSEIYFSPKTTVFRKIFAIFR